MHEDQKLSELIGQIYDAALDPALWGNVLGKTSKFVGGRGAALAWKDAVSKSGDVYYDDGAIDLQYRQLYFDKYIKLDPCTTGQFFAEIDVPVATADLIPYEQFLETRFYKEWARPQGLVDAVLCLIDKAVTHMAFWECFGINAMAWSTTKRGDA